MANKHFHWKKKKPSVMDDLARTTMKNAAKSEMLKEMQTIKTSRNL
jgi:hypothetical protein